MSGAPREALISFKFTMTLNDKYWDGKIEREYRHEMEAFI